MVLGKIVHNAKKNLETLLITIDMVGLELNAGKSEHIFVLPIVCGEHWKGQGLTVSRHA